MSQKPSFCKQPSTLKQTATPRPVGLAISFRVYALSWITFLTYRALSTQNLHFHIERMILHCSSTRSFCFQEIFQIINIQASVNVKLIIIEALVFSCYEYISIYLNDYRITCVSVHQGCK